MGDAPWRSVFEKGNTARDFKRRVFVKKDTLDRCRPDILGVPQPNGWYPDNKEYIMYPSEAHFLLHKNKADYPGVYENANLGTESSLHARQPGRCAAVSGAWWRSASV